MSVSTSDSIISETINLVSRYPLNKVTVKKIVEACNITRNTFYYHFKDVYDVIDCAVDTRLKEITNQDSLETVDEKLFSLISFLYDNRKVLKNIYISIGHEEFIKFISAKNSVFFDSFFDNLENADKINPLDRKIVLGFYSEAVTSLLITWLLNPKGNDSFEYFTTVMNRVRVLFKGNTALYIKNSLENPLDTK